MLSLLKLIINYAMNPSHKIITAVGTKGLICLYPKRNYWKSLRWPLLISLILTTYVAFSEENFIIIISFLSDRILSSVPTILGFILTGYALIIGLTGTDTVQKMSKKNDDDSISLFQKVNSTFAFVLISLVFIGLIGFIVLFIVKLKLTTDLPEDIICFFNIITIWFLVLCMSYALFAIKDIVINVFNFGQYVHSLNFIKNIQEIEYKTHEKDPAEN